MENVAKKDPYAFSAKLYFPKCAFAYLISIITTGAYLAKLTTTIGISDGMTAILSSIGNLACFFQFAAIPLSHPLVAAAQAIGRQTFISPTTSDRAIMQGLPALKMGVGESSRSHTADEFVLTSEIEEGIALYQKLLDELNNTL